MVTLAKFLTLWHFSFQLKWGTYLPLPSKVLSFLDLVSLLPPPIHTPISPVPLVLITVSQSWLHIRITQMAVLKMADPGPHPEPLN